MNLLGQQVATLYEGHHEAGRYTYRFDASNLPSGVYIARLSVNGTMLLRKMTLMK